MNIPKHILPYSGIEIEQSLGDFVGYELSAYADSSSLSAHLTQTDFQSLSSSVVGDSVTFDGGEE